MNSALFYGPDHGLIEYSIGKISKILGLERRNVSFSDISAEELDILLNNISLFGAKEIIVLKDLPSNINATMKELLAKQHHNILIISAGELTPSSPLRKIFEAEKFLAAIPCYNDNEDMVEQIVKSYLTKEKKSISPDAMRFIKHNLYGDRFIIINELEKLFCYCNSKERIELEDVEDVICRSSSSDPDKLCMYFLSSDLANYFKELNRILENNVPSVWVIRALIRYHINVYVCTKKIASGLSIDTVVESLSPPIFFKYKPMFKKALGSFTEDKVQNSLKKLYEAEKTIKSGVSSDKQILTEIFF